MVGNGIRRLGDTAALLYAAAAFGLGFASFLGCIGFLGNLALPKTIDAGASPLAGSGLPPIVLDLALLGVFGLQHSAMARPGFKRRWVRIVPPALERSTYVLASGLALWLSMALWQPLPGAVWRVETPWAAALLSAGPVLGAALILYAIALLNWAEFYGLRRVGLRWLGRPWRPAPIATRSIYRFTRHPLYWGWAIALWATPVMSLGHLLWAAFLTSYILWVVPVEEREMAARFGEPYRRYRESVPGWLPGAAARTRARGGRDAGLPPIPRPSWAAVDASGDPFAGAHRRAA